LALPVTARNGCFRFPKLNVVGSNPISRSRKLVRNWSCDGEAAAVGGGKPLRHARDAAKPGDLLEVTMTAVDRGRRRPSLAPAGESEAIDAEARGATDGAAGGAKLGTLGDLFKLKK
jgi:hypothetical protein